MAYISLLSPLHLVMKRRNGPLSLQIWPIWFIRRRATLGRGSRRAGSPLKGAKGAVGTRESEPGNGLGIDASTNSNYKTEEKKGRRVPPRSAWDLGDGGELTEARPLGCMCRLRLRRLSPCSRGRLRFSSRRGLAAGRRRAPGHLARAAESSPPASFSRQNRGWMPCGACTGCWSLCPRSLAPC